MKTAITNARIILPTGIYSGEVLVENGKIAAVSFQCNSIQDADVWIDAKEQYLSPGFIDIHTHGGGGCDFTTDQISDVQQACKMHLLHGTTSIVPTLLTSSPENLASTVKFFNTIPFTRDHCAEILGIHLEGPYFAHSQCGAQNPLYLRNPQKEEYEKILKASNRILRWSFAVELPGAIEFLTRLREEKIEPSIAHTDATFDEVLRAYENGAACLTHFYSAMSTVKRVEGYRVAGCIEAGYLLDDMMVEVIADGHHLPSSLLQLIYKIKGSDKICLVTDSMNAAGMPEGKYSLGGVPCIVENGVAKLLDRSAFAGSVATTDQLVRTFKALTNAPLHEVIKMITLNPAKAVHVEDRKGSIAIGKDADLLLFDDDINFSMIMVKGKLVSNKCSTQ